MPAFIVLNGMFLRFGLDFYAAGVVSSLVGVLSLVAGVALFCRRSGLSWAQALCAVSCILGWTLLVAMIQVRADILAAGLTALGLAIIIGKERLDIGDLLFASLFFALAWATKLTALHGPAAVFLYLALSRRNSEATRFAFAATAVLLVVGALCWIGSDGRVLQIFGPTASSGTDLNSVLKAPFRFVNMLKADGPGFLLFFASCIVFAVDWKNSFRSLPGIHFVLVTLATLVVLCSPGTTENHFVELHASALCFLAYSGVRHFENNVFFSYSLILLAMFQVFSATLFFKNEVYTTESSTKHVKYEEIVKYFGRGTQVLSENPSVPLALGSHVVIQDPFMLRVLAENDPEVNHAIRKMLSDRKFEYVVLGHDLATLGPGYEYPSRHLGAAFVESMRSNYKHLEEVGGFHVYVPAR
ncbi:MAG: hypothetical protein Q7J24_07795 [Desulfomicrobium sp.]|nr:hypothetical protein [Desulfomicrobium sp.]